MIAIENRWMRKTARALGLACGIWWLMFTLLSHGISAVALIEALPFGIAILVATALAWKWEVAGGTLLILEGIAYLVFTAMPVGKAPLAGLIFLLLTLSLPTLLAGVLFVVHWKRLSPLRASRD